MKNILISILSNEDLIKIHKLTTLYRGSCYKTAFDLVVINKIAKKYVLGFSINENNSILTPHAWVKLFSEKYADPLLQYHKQILKTSYISVHELNISDILQLLRHKHSFKFEDVVQGNRDYFPPSIGRNGHIIMK